jgi:hypothetical protein
VGKIGGGKVYTLFPGKGKERKGKKGEDRVSEEKGI